MKNKAMLRSQCSGVDSPEQMGTTGLVAWVLHGLPDKNKSRNRWERFLVAKRIIKARGMKVTLFVDAIISTALYYGINLKRFHQATVARKINKASLPSKYYPWLPAERFLTPGSELAEMNEMDAKHPNWQTMEDAGL